MTGMPEKPALSRTVAQLVFGAGGGIASTVYGTVVVMATLTVGYASESHPWKLAELVWSSAFVLWIAHLYAHGLSESITRRLRLRDVGLASIARRELGILLAAAAPSAALLLGALDLVHEDRAVWLALAIGLVTLAAEGIRYARIESLGRLGTFVAIALNLGLGSFVVILKVALAH
jgi:hypothetical protein